MALFGATKLTKAMINAKSETGTNLLRRWTCFFRLLCDSSIACNFKQCIASPFTKMLTEEDLAQSNQKKDKASGQKQQRENGSQTDKDLDGRHCCEASAKLLEMNAKLDKLLTLFGEIESLKTRLTSVEEENKQLKDAVNFTEQDITDLKKLHRSTWMPMWIRMQKNLNPLRRRSLC